jgi:cyanophycinase
VGPLREDAAMDVKHGTVLLLGGREHASASLGAAILSSAPGRQVAVIPTASAFEGPEAAVLEIANWLVGLGAEVEGLMVSTRSDAELEEMARRLERADLAYLSDGTALHLCSTLRETVLFSALLGMLASGKTVVASGAAAAALCDPMIDPRGGAPTVGLGPIFGFTVVPHVGRDGDDLHQEKLHRTVGLVSAMLPVVAISSGAGLRCGPDGRCEPLGDAGITVYLDRQVLPGGVTSLGPWWERPG